MVFVLLLGAVCVGYVVLVVFASQLTGSNFNRSKEKKFYGRIIKYLLV